MSSALTRPGRPFGKKRKISRHPLAWGTPKSDWSLYWKLARLEPLEEPTPKRKPPGPCCRAWDDVVKRDSDG